MDDGHVLERNFVDFVRELIVREHTGQDVIADEEAVISELRADIVAAIPDESRIILVEAKLTGPQTAERLRRVASDLSLQRELHRHRYGRVRHLDLALATPDPISANYRELLSESGIQAWDGPLLFDWANSLGMTEAARPFLRGQFDRRARAQFSNVAPAQPEAAVQFELDAIGPGQPNWVEYQRACKNLLELLFVPPLEMPEYESATEAGVNRRDIVMANYASSGFWRFMREQYRAEFIVFDAKNLKGLATKAHVLQLANYLSQGGLGLFGVILTRNGINRAGSVTQREQWLLHRKMILTLTHSDLNQMLELHLAGEAPDIVIRQMLQDFRLSI